MLAKKASTRSAPVLVMVAMTFAALLLTGAKTPVDEEVFYPAPLAYPRTLAPGSDTDALVTLLPLLNAASPKPECSDLWAPHEEERAGGRSEVMAAVSLTLIGSKSYCEKRSTFQTSACRIAKEESLSRATHALIRGQNGHFIFNSREKKRVELVFVRTLKVLLESVAHDARFSDDEKEQISSRLKGVSLSTDSFETDLPAIQDEAARNAVKNQCLDASGRFLVDNSFLLGNKIYLCPFHIAKAFANDEGRPEEIMVFNLAHLLAHSIDYNALRKHPPGAYNKAMGCYGSKFAGPDDTYGLKRPETFRSGTEVLCCCPTPAGEGGVRSCLDSKGCAPQGAPAGTSCDVRDYMSELISDQWAYTALGRYVKHEQDYAVGKTGKLPEFIARQNRDLVSKNLYIYCDAPNLRREDHPEQDPATLFTQPRTSFRLAEARKNPWIAQALLCPYELGDVQEQFGPVCWGAKEKKKSPEEDE